jgi:hypothetical protein
MSKSLDHRNKRTASVNGDEHNDQPLIRGLAIPALDALVVDGLIEEPVAADVVVIPVVAELALDGDPELELELEGPEVVTLLTKIPAGVTVSEAEPFAFKYAPRLS